MKLSGNNWKLILIIAISFTSCSSEKTLLKVSEDSYRYLKIPKLKLNVRYPFDYVFSSGIKPHEEKEILGILSRGITAPEISKGRFIYKAYTISRPFVKEYLFKFNISKLPSTLNNFNAYSYNETDTAYTYIFYHSNSAYILIHLKNKDFANATSSGSAAEFEAMSKREFESIIKTITFDTIPNEL